MLVAIVIIIVILALVLGISAIVKAITRQSASVTTNDTPKYENLANYKKLLDEGTITQAEFEKLKQNALTPYIKVSKKEKKRIRIITINKKQLLIGAAAIVAIIAVALFLSNFLAYKNAPTTFEKGKALEATSIAKAYEVYKKIPKYEPAKERIAVLADYAKLCGEYAPSGHAFKKMCYYDEKSKDTKDIGQYNAMVDMYYINNEIVLKITFGEYNNGKPLVGSSKDIEDIFHEGMFTVEIGNESCNFIKKHR